MAWNGSGTYVRVHNWAADAAVPLDILPARMDAEDDSIASGINNCIAKDGQNSATADLPMGNNRHTGVGDGSSRNHYASIKQVLNGSLIYAGTSSAGTDAYAAATAISIVSLVTGMEVVFIADVANTGGCTFVLNGIGSALPIYMQDGSAPPSNYILAGAIVRLHYTGTDWRLMSVTAVVVNTTSTQTLTNKTLTSPTLNTATINNSTLNSPTINSPTITGWSLATANVSSAGVISNGPAGWTAAKGATGTYTLTHSLSLASPAEQQVHITSDDGVAGQVAAVVTVMNANFITYILKQVGTTSTVDASHMVLFTSGGLG